MKRQNLSSILSKDSLHTNTLRQVTRSQEDSPDAPLTIADTPPANNRHHGQAHRRRPRPPRRRRHGLRHGLQRRLGPLSRRGIVVMTLLGGFASTVFIPLTHLLIQALGWRDALLALALLVGGFGVAIHWLAIPPQQPRAATSTTAPIPPSNARRVLRAVPFWGFVTCVVVQGIIGAGLPVHFIALLTERGFSIEAAVLAFTVIGPAQVAARFLVGVAEQVGQALFPTYSVILTFLIMAVVLAVRPQGIMGRPA